MKDKLIYLCNLAVAILLGSAIAAWITAGDMRFLLIVAGPAIAWFGGGWLHYAGYMKALDDLEKEGYVTVSRKPRWALTDKGMAAAKKLCEEKEGQ